MFVEPPNCDLLLSSVHFGKATTDFALHGSHRAFECAMKFIQPYEGDGFSPPNNGFIPLSRGPDRDHAGT